MYKNTYDYGRKKHPLIFMILCNPVLNSRPSPLYGPKIVQNKQSNGHVDTLGSISVFLSLFVFVHSSIILGQLLVDRSYIDKDFVHNLGDTPSS